MEDQSQDANNNSPSHGSAERSTEPVRSRWTPKPEQILILESIFNSGMVNPPKDETVRIRKLLEKFGSVGDANVFYWFQNRRSRSRRRQRQLQASLAGEQRNSNIQQAQASSAAGAIQYEINNNCAAAALPMGFAATSPATFGSTPCTNFVGGSSSFCGVMGGDDGVETLYSVSGQMGFQEVVDQNSSVTSMLCPSESSNLQYQTGFITVFINGAPTEIPRGPIDVKALFGQDVILVHSSGVPIPTNEFGFLMQSLQHGESYFLVSRPA